MRLPEEDSSSAPTVGSSYETARSAVQTFLGWLPPRWIPRPEDPDFHIDYVIEIVKDGEPTGTHFRAQIKGRTAKGSSTRIVESFKTKHLRYYAKCEQPVFLFRIDPITKGGYWLFIQGYLKEKKLTDERLSGQKKLSITFDPLKSLEAKSLFQEELAKALRLVRDQFPGSPTAAIEAHQRELESIDPRFEVKVEANETGMRLTLHPKDPSAIAPPTIFANLTNQHVQSLELGDPLVFKASELKVDLPILEKILKEAGDGPVTLATHRQMAGHARLSFVGDGSFDSLQVNGNWNAAPRRLQFEGEIPESPLKLSFNCIADQPMQFVNPKVTIGFDFDRWANQPLQHLAHFDDIARIVKGGNLDIRFSARGHQFYCGIMSDFNFSAEPRAPRFLEWISRCRKAAAFLKCNPLFPASNNFSSLETQEIRFLLQMLETGRYEEPYDGDPFSMSGEMDRTFEPDPNEPGQFETTNQYRDIDFLGVKVSLGPLKYSFSDLRLIEAKKESNGHQTLKWIGGPSCIFLMKMAKKGRLP